MRTLKQIIKLYTLKTNKYIYFLSKLVIYEILLCQTKKDH